MDYSSVYSRDERDFSQHPEDRLYARGYTAASVIHFARNDSCMDCTCQTTPTIHSLPHTTQPEYNVQVRKRRKTDA